jgi:tRNA A58 N-methylase Trm61
MTADVDVIVRNLRLFRCRDRVDVVNVEHSRREIRAHLVFVNLMQHTPPVDVIKRALMGGDNVVVFMPYGSDTS